MKNDFKPIEIASMLSCKDLSLACGVALGRPDRFWKGYEASKLRIEILHNKLLLHMASQPEIYDAVGR